MINDPRIILPGRLPGARRRFLAGLGTLGSAALLAPYAQLLAADGDDIGGLGCIEPSIFVDGFETVPGSCVLIPSETAGPYPLYSVLNNAAMLRRDLTEGRAGVPLRLKLKVVNLNAACAPLKDVAVYVWHCDKDGVYSGYSQPGANTTGQTFCRGIQYTDCNGIADFTTLYPGWYSGRITHVHFQIYLNLSGSVTATSQFAIPQVVTTTVYNSSLYAAHGQNTSVASIAQDNVFSDGASNQMLTISGDTVDGYDGRLQIGVAV